MGTKSRPGYRFVHIECNRHYLHIQNQTTGKTRPCNGKDIVHKLPIELWNVDTMFGRAGKFINHLANLPTILLNADYDNITYNHIRKKNKNPVTHKNHPFSVYSS